MNTELTAKYALYPPAAQAQLKSVRTLIYAIAKELQLPSVEESIKWGEASYWVKGGSAIRLDWKPDTPNTIKLFFHCQTKLVETFRELYPSELHYEGKRAIIIPLAMDVTTGPLAHCLQLAMTYHKVKHLPMLGA